MHEIGLQKVKINIKTHSETLFFDARLMVLFPYPWSMPSHSSSSRRRRRRRRHGVLAVGVAVVDNAATVATTGRHVVVVVRPRPPMLVAT